MVHTPRKETRENCHTAFVVKYCLKRDAYIVNKFVKEHSHRLANSHEVPFLRSHWCVTESNIAQSISIRKASIKTNQTYDYMVNQASVYVKVGFPSKDLYNMMDFERRQVDAISYMNAKAIADLEFFCMFSVDEENRLANLFLRDSQSLHDYCCIGNVLIFDSMYKTNVYDKPLVVFVGVNNHNATTVFGCTFLVDETADTYRWNFLTSVKDKKPVSIVADGDEAMRVAIDEVFPDAHHHLCSWHIMRNVNSNVNNSKIVREFSYCMHGGLTPVAFEQHWQHMIDAYDLKGDWIEMMYCKRKRWTEGHFFGGNTTTQRVEGMHKNLKDRIGRGMKLVEYILQIERSLLKLRNENVKDDFDSNNSHALLLTHLRSLEEHVASIFTQNLQVDKK
ncbi:LOW QUALITY PROTEIN: hypothetical protein PRUPE_2G034100 [Prunus persica]|uniref:MULE transposase domain-containing protein n=1 Tax=Prunus persica TaxID=3760 RepID=A0A251QAK0_PRUPE|nr:LOW QUALITY PROTEIN: hypothetical protein PRUPE_2G034100 [Prunus persica]